ncbi:MAG: MFS transporter [Steroidobacteraceae bacterium]
MSPTRQPGPLAVLRHGNLARFALSRFCVTIAWQMLGVAVGWQVYRLTGDPLALGLIGLWQFLPFVCLVMVGGHAADHLDRRHVLVAAFAVESLCVAALLWFTLGGLRAVWPVYLAVGTFGATRAFWAPAGQAILPSLVPREQFADAVAVNAILFQVAVIAGPALGGLLFLLGAAVVYGVCLALFLLALVVMAGARTPPLGTGGEMALDAQFLEGVRFVLRERAVLGVISLDLFAVLFGGATALLPIFANDLLRVGPVGLGLLRTAPGAGAALTAALLALRPIRRHAGAWMFGGVAVFGLATIAFGLSQVFALSLLALFIAGAADMLSVYIRGILVQLRTPDAIRGRVSAVNSMFIGASNELGEFESGVTARWFGAVPAVLVGGLCTLAVVAAWLRRFPELRKLDRLH